MPVEKRLVSREKTKIATCSTFIAVIIFLESAKSSVDNAILRPMTMVVNASMDIRVKWDCVTKRIPWGAPAVKARNTTDE